MLTPDQTSSISRLRLTLIALCISVSLTTTGCNLLGGGGGSTITTTSSYAVQVGGGTVKQADPTGFVAIDVINPADEQGCFSDGLPQPPPFGPPGSSYPFPSSMGTSPSVGQCQFSPYAWPGTWSFDLFSGQCSVSGFGGDSGLIWNQFTGSGSWDPGPLCTIPDYAAPAADNHFALSGALPTTVTVSAKNLATTYGMPQLLAFDRFFSLKTTVTASSVASDGSNATFPFPTGLSGGMYMFAVKNFSSANHPNIVDATHFSIGGTTNLSSAFGVDAADVAQYSITCVVVGGKPFCRRSLTTYTPVPILTQYYANQVSYSGHAILVGTQPVAVKFFGTYLTTQNGGDGVTTYTTSPANAIAVNSGSNSVSILNLKTDTVTANIPVGTQPLSVTLNSAGTYAYVPNYGSGTLSEVNLSTLAVSRTVPIAAGVQSVAMDPSGNYVWVGGSNYLYEVSLSSFAVVGSYAVNGSVTSLAASNAQNKLAYTLVQNCCTTSSTYSANEVAISSLSTTTAFSRTSASPYAQYTMNGTLPSAAVVPQATTVSSQFGNGLAASSTPSGFVVYDIVSNQPLMSGNTPTPVRGIASDPQNQIVYFTLPDSNEYLAVPLPYAP